VQRQYIESGKVILAFRHLPLRTAHPFALQAAQAAYCAGQQRKFWPFHDRLFGEDVKLDETAILKNAGIEGLEMDQFNGCRGSELAATFVQGDIDKAKELGISSTPTFLIGANTAEGVKVSSVIEGAHDFADFRKAIEAILGQR